MNNLINEELYRMKYLFSHERGRVISEQQEGYLIKEAIGELPKDQAEADKFKVWLKQTHPEFRCRVGKSKGMTISTTPGRAYTGPCFKDVWKLYGEVFVSGSTTQTQSKVNTPISEPDVATDEKNEPVTTTNTTAPTTTTNTTQGAATNTTQGAATNTTAPTTTTNTTQGVATNEPEESSTEK